MTAYLRNPLTIVWAVLTASTLAAWWIGGGRGGVYHLDAAVTFGVLMIAAVKAHLVIRYFMEVRFAPTWLKHTTNGWVVLLFTLMLVAY